MGIKSVALSALPRPSVHSRRGAVEVLSHLRNLLRQFIQISFERTWRTRGWKYDKSEQAAVRFREGALLGRHRVGLLARQTRHVVGRVEFIEGEPGNRLEVYDLWRDVERLKN